ncbi:MAG: MGMT family protein [Synechococcaceae cyanobacterium]|nr:MGMT family protein [Synechococcaceae cyanobacterium]
MGLPDTDSARLPSDLRPFDRRVYAVVARIPSGRLATYGQIAELIGAWGCARQVGWALRRLPLPSPIPWHRVVNARGCVTMSPGREGSDWMQRELLRAEGIPVDGEGRLPLARHRWAGDSRPDGVGPPGRAQGRAGSVDGS